MRFPREEVYDISCETEKESVHQMLEASGVERKKVVWVGCTKYDYFVHLEADKDIRDMSPNMLSISALGRRGTMITAASDLPDEDYVARFFAPQLGIPEDPVTGSAHCALAPYWGEKLKKGEVIGYQASKRGGRVVSTLEDETIVTLKGSAIM